MTDKNQVTITPNAIIGYVDDSTPCGRAKAKQVKADLETLATMLQDTNLSMATKKAITMDYGKAIREYVEREETCCGCNCNCDYEEEDEPYEEEEEEITIDDMERYSIYYSNERIDTESYIEATEIVETLMRFNLTPEVWGYDNNGKDYALTIIDRRGSVSFELV